MNDDNSYNDPIERLFREKAGEYNFPYREEDWLKLEKRLDIRDMKRGYRRRMAWMAAASVLILSLIGYYTFQNHNKLNQLAEQLNQNEVIEQTEHPENEPGELPLDADENPDQTEPVQETREEDEFAERSGEEEVAGQPNSQDLDSESAVAGIEKHEGGNLANEGFAEAGQVIQRKSLDPVGFYITLAPDVLPERGLMHPFWLAEQQAEEENGDSYFEPDNGTLALRTDDSVDPEDSFQASRFAVGFVVSPDMSTVGAVSNFYDPGFKGGLLAEYSLGKRFSLMSGVTVSNVKYKAAGQTYDPPRYWNSGVLPDETTAVCLVLDIPLNLKANLFNFKRSRIFATAGVSSYIMLNEDYQFSYDNDSSGLQTSWSERTGTRHWLSNAGFSVGFEYDLSPNWTVRAEPHIKVPLRGVGWGNVDLYSLGTFVSLNYRFGRFLR